MIWLGLRKLLAFSSRFMCFQVTAKHEFVTETRRSACQGESEVEGGGGG